MSRRNYDYLRLLKTIFNYRCGIEYEISGMLPYLVGESDIVFDIGANIGQYACWLKDLVGSSGRVFCFEPERANCKMLKKMKRLLHMDSVEILNIALSHTSGRQKLYVPILRDRVVIATRAALRPVEMKYENVKFDVEEVEIDTIDNVVKKMKIPRLNLIKCDAEGEEIRIIEGGEETVKRLKPLLILEIHYMNEELNYIYDLGYVSFVYVPKEIKFIKAEQSKYAEVEGSLTILIHESNIEKYNSLILGQ
jgi:FkbM family methyltransferase